MARKQANNSNTKVIVVILLIVAGLLAVWYFAVRETEPETYENGVPPLPVEFQEPGELEDNTGEGV